MLHVPVGANTFCLSTPSWGTTRPAAANGTAVTPGTGAYGTAVQIGSDLTQDTFGLLININSNSGSAASRNTVIKIGIDESGGTSPTNRITGLMCGGASAYNNSGGGIWYYFPLFIPSGSAIFAAAYGSVTTAIRVGCVSMQKPANPALIRKGSFTETLGIGTTTGTAITLGTTTEGAWTSVGTTTNRMWWWQMGLQIGTADTAWGAGAIHCDLGVGDGTVGGTDVIIQDANITTTTAELLSNPPLTAGVEWDVPAGSTIYIRGQHSGTVDTGTAVAAYGLGG